MTIPGDQDHLIAKRVRDSVDFWSCRLISHPEAYFGKPLPSQEPGVHRLGAKPVPIHHEGSDPRTLFLTNFSVERSDSAPVLLDSGTKIRLRFRMSKPTPLYVGVSVRRLRGSFAGKFVAAFDPEGIGPIGTWCVFELPLEALKASVKVASQSPAGYQLGNLYVYTENEDASLEISKVEVFSTGDDEEKAESLLDRLLRLVG